MDILKILQQSGEDLYLEDLEFFETELDTGKEYDEEYQCECRKIIYRLRSWLKGEKSDRKTKEKKDDKTPKRLFVDIDKLAPKESNPIVENLTSEQIFLQNLRQLREDPSYKQKFKTLLKESNVVDESFIEKYYSVFETWELSAIVSIKPLNEGFLEKYFGALDHDKIARYQLFSEGFFMKHFAQLDTDIVLCHGKNEWRKKEKRSKQLDVFLRLKGVKK